eukprot:gene33277-41063_t
MTGRAAAALTLGQSGSGVQTSTSTRLTSSALTILNNEKELNRRRKRDEVTVVSVDKFDGGAQPNPGAGGSDKITNNQAEYFGLLEGLKNAAALKIQKLHIKDNHDMALLKGYLQAVNLVCDDTQRERDNAPPRLQ